MNQKEKTKFRNSSKWKDFRKKMKSLCNGIDFITGKKLIKGWNLHHKNISEKDYADISDTDDFVCLNKQTHEFIHWAFRYYTKDPDFIIRFQKILDEMKDYITKDK